MRPWWEQPSASIRLDVHRIDAARGRGRGRVSRPSYRRDVHNGHSGVIRGTTDSADSPGSVPTRAKLLFPEPERGALPWARSNPCQSAESVVPFFNSLP